jgi:hypothetical protein
MLQSKALAVPCRLTLVTAPDTPGQRHAWACLWRLLLAQEEPHREAPKNVEASERTIPEVSKNCGLDSTPRSPQRLKPERSKRGMRHTKPQARERPRPQNDRNRGGASSTAPYDSQPTSIADDESA